MSRLANPFSPPGVSGSCDDDGDGGVGGDPLQRRASARRAGSHRSRRSGRGGADDSALQSSLTLPRVESSDTVGVMSVCSTRHNSVRFDRENDEWCDDSQSRSSSSAGSVEVMDLRSRRRSTTRIDCTDHSESLASLGSMSGAYSDGDQSRSSALKLAAFLLNSGILNKKDGEMFPVASVVDAPVSDKERSGDDANSLDSGTKGRPRHWARLTRAGNKRRATLDAPPAHWATPTPYDHHVAVHVLPEFRSRSLGDAGSVSEHGSDSDHTPWSNTSTRADAGETRRRRGVKRALRCVAALTACALLAAGGVAVLARRLPSYEGRWLRPFHRAGDAAALWLASGARRGGLRLVRRQAGVAVPDYQITFWQHDSVVQDEAPVMLMQGEQGRH